MTSLSPFVFVGLVLSVYFGEPLGVAACLYVVSAILLGEAHERTFRRMRQPWRFLALAFWPAVCVAGLALVAWDAARSRVGGKPGGGT